MEPIDVAYAISQYYIRDLVDVDPALVTKIDGYRRSRNLAGLASCSRHFDSAKHTVRDWQALRQVEAFFKKNADFADPDVCLEASRASFFEAEKLCVETNRRLRRFIGHTHLLDECFRNWITRMQRYIYNVLSDHSRFLELLPSLVRVTPGATSTRARRDSLPQLKMRLKIFSTRRSFPYIRSLYHLFGFEEGLRMKAVTTNRVELVPKNWKTHRTIACEPEGNLPLQLAFDSWTKKRLRLFRIDLSDQSRNQRLAKQASLDNSLVTVDFKAASDTISFNTVSLLFPADWFEYLWRVRSPEYRGVFGRGVYSKFSSMGNGSTFCVETLIFAAACHAVGSSDYSVYGDDVIIEREYFDDFKRLTAFLGFTINKEKTFDDGPFRESCGKDFFSGIDVTPMYIRSIGKRKAFLCHLINTLSSIATFGGHLESFLLRLCKENKLPLVPLNSSSLSGVWIDPDRARSLGILKRRFHMDTFKAYQAKSSLRKFGDIRGYYLWFLSKQCQVTYAGPWDFSRRGTSCSETSVVPVYDHVYVRRRAFWHGVPETGMPVHLYWWTELLSPN